MDLCGCCMYHLALGITHSCCKYYLDFWRLVYSYACGLLVSLIEYCGLHSLANCVLYMFEKHCLDVFESKQEILF